MTARIWKKEAFIVFVLFSLCMNNCACTTRWTEETARKEVFHNIKRNINITQYSAIDPNFEENQKALREGRTRVADRFITANSEPSIGYVVSKMDDGDNVRSTMFYGKDGRLLSVRLFSRQSYPRTAYIYCVDKESCRRKNEVYEPGDLMSVSLHISGREKFYFKQNGRFSGHIK